MAKTEKDPVCQADVDPKSSKNRSEFQGKTYHFCSADCKQEFQKQPERYARELQTAHH
jgi:Cu+-exporting ATPase